MRNPASEHEYDLRYACFIVSKAYRSKVLAFGKTKKMICFFAHLIVPLHPKFIIYNVCVNY